MELQWKVITWHLVFYYYPSPILANFCPLPPLCAQMDFTQTFQTKTKCNKINHVCSYFYKILVVLKYHRCLWANIFDTDINRCINTYIKVVYLAFFGIFMLLQMSLSKILAHRRLCYFKSNKLLQKLLQTWFILLQLAVISNVRIKSIWTHIAPLPGLGIRAPYPALLKPVIGL